VCKGSQQGGYYKRATSQQLLNRFLTLGSVVVGSGNSQQGGCARVVSRAVL